MKAMRKRIMWFAILLLAICNKIAAEDRVYVSDFSISPGETRQVSVMLDNEDAYVGFQFDVYLPEGFTITSCSKSDRIPDGTTVLGNQRTDDTGSFYRVIGASLAGNAITGTSGAIATLTITADASVALNDYTGYLRNIKVSKANGTGLTKDQETFTITVKNPEPYAALSSDNKTLTFYYDSQKQTRSGMSIGPFASGSNISWYSQRTSITTVVFDASFANYTNLTSTAYWFIGCHNLTTITGIANLKTDNVTSMVSMFSNCVNLHWVDVSGFNTSNVTDMSNMFMNCSKLEYVDVTHFNTAKVNNMSGMFYGCTDLSGLDVSGFDTGNVTTMKEMFRDCSSLSTLDVSNFNTAKVTTMLGMFFGCSHLRALEFGNNFVTSKVQSMSQMFAGCKYLEALDLSNFDTSNVLGMYNMFESCWGLTSLDLSTFNTANLLDMSAMFYDCANLKSINLSSFNTAKVTNMAAMFYECPDLTKLDLKNFNTAKVKEMARMFYNCTSLTTIDVGSEWSTASITDSGENMFSGCTNLKGVSGTTYDASHIDKEYARIDEGTANPGYLTGPIPEPYAVLTDNDDDVTTDDGTVKGKTLTFYYDTKKEERGGMSVGPFDINSGASWKSERDKITTVVFDDTFADCTSLTSTAQWFSLCSKLKTITGIANLKTDNVTSMLWMFESCSSLTSLDVSGFNTEKVSDMVGMFSGCSSLTSLDVSNFNTDNVVDMADMFSYCSNLTSLDLSNFNTEHVIRLSTMFYECSGLESVDLSSFNTTNVEDMGYMFYNCSKLNSLDLSSFNTSKVKYDADLNHGIKSMFSGCSALTTIYAGDGWTIENLTESTDVFKDCTALVGGKGTTYDANHTDYTYAHIDGGTDNPGYFTKVAEPEPYAVLTDNEDDVTTDDGTVKGKTLTFYYDTKKGSRGGMSIGPFGTEEYREWNDDCAYITTVVFDASFANCTTMTSTAWWFKNCKNLTTITGISNLKTDNVTDMIHMFNGCSALTSLDLSGFNTENVRDMTHMFTDCSSLKILDLRSFKTDKVYSMWGMFNGCSSLNSLDVSSFNTAKVSQMTQMFYKCSSLEELDVSNFKTDNVYSLYGMFHYCSGLKSLDVSGFNTENVESMDVMFSGCSNLTNLDVSGFNTENVESIHGMFSECSSLTSIDVSGFNTEKVTRMDGMFSECSSLTSIDVSGFNTEKVTKMDYMFFGCSGLTSLDVSGFKTDNVTDMSRMFSGCSGLTSLDVSGFKTDNVTDMNSMFSDCSGLTSLDVSSFNTTNATTMGSMFSGCSSLTNLDLSSFNTANVKPDAANYYGIQYMFSDCSALTTVYVGENWTIENLTEVFYVFKDCTALVGGQGTKYDAEHTDYTYAHIDGGTDNPGYFTRSGDEPYKEKEPYAVLTYNEDGIIIKGDTIKTKTLTFYYDTKKEERNGMSVGPFDNYLQRGWINDTTLITTVVFDTSFANCTTLTSTAFWFYQFSNLVSLRGLANFKTNNVTDMHCMFYGCSKITDLDLGSQNTANVTNMSSMFDGCSSLKNVNLLLFNTENVTDMNAMFYKCSSLTDLNMSSFNTEKVTNMQHMFFGCTGLTSLDVTIFNTANVTSMLSMFYGCSGLTSIDLSSFKTDKVTDMRAMFFNCSSLTTIYAGNKWNTEALTADSVMFSGCTNLVGSAGTVYDANHIDAKYAHIDGGADNPGYFSEKGPEPYASLSDNNTVLTFYYDGKKMDREGMSVGPFAGYSDRGWYEQRENITKVVFDDSFAQYTELTSTFSWFDQGKNIVSIEGLSNLNTENVVNMHSMFEACSSLTTLDLSHFNTAKVKDFGNMFAGCSNLTTIYVGEGWSTEAVTEESTNMFAECTKLVGGVGTVYDADHIDKAYAHIDGGTSDPGYLTDKNKKDVTITAKSCSRGYGEANPTFEYTVEGATLIGKPTITCEATATSPVGTYPIAITYTAEDASKMNLTYVNGTLTITKAPLTITAKSYTIKRGSALPTFEVEYSGFKNNETDTIFTKKAVATCEAKADTVAGTYQIVVSGAEAANYEMEYVNGTLTITDDVVVTAKSYTREYGDANPTFEYTVDGATLEGTPAITCEATATSPIGTYDIIIAKGNITNKDVTFVNGTLTITKAKLKATAKSYTIKRGSALPTFEVEYSGFKNNETDTIFTKKAVATCEAKADTVVGTYQIVVSGAEAANYVIEYVNGTLTITDDVVVTAKSYTREYGDANPTFEYTVDGATLEGTPAITCEATATSPVGTYDIIIAKGNITNKDVTFVKGTLTITKAPLTITAKSYTVKQGKDLPALKLEYSGFKNNETDTVFTTKPTVTTKATKNSAPGTYEITVSGAEANNYEIKHVNGTLTITEKAESFDGIVLTVDKGGDMDDAFEEYGGREEAAKTIAAIIWNNNVPLTDAMLKGISNPNLLVYVSEASMAPKDVKNLVVNGKATNIVLVDADGNNNFFVPQEFTTEDISYSRIFKQTTQDGISRGWEGICLPFDVQKFIHEEHGEISPFANSTCDYHFWLRQPTDDGVINALSIEANKPYIISMPNSDEYDPEFNHPGLLRFISSNVTIPATKVDSVWLGDSAQIAPTFLNIEAAPDIYVLNVGDSIMNHREGSIFISNYRSARPFEVYTIHEPRANETNIFGSRIISLSSLFGGNGTTGIIDAMKTTEPNGESWYDMNGRRLQGKPARKGIYILNGKKVVIK